MSTIERITITLTAEMAQAVRGAVLAGEYASSSEIILDVADLGALDCGTGPDVVAFVDPQCPHCAAFFKDLASLADRYRFRLIPLPITEESQSEVLALHCLATIDRAAALAALLEHRADVPAATGTCGQPTAQRTLITAQMFGVRGTPFVIAPDGRIH